jgi:hypothetical protein
MEIMVANFDAQYERIALDEAWDKYLEECAIDGVPSMPYSVWVRESCPNDSKR